MTPTEALQLLAQVAAHYKGNLKEHETLQKAVECLKNVLGEKQKES